jgi:hypothetical protein
VSGATYRIELDHTPGEAFRYYARVYLLADDFAPVFTKHGDQSGDVLNECRQWIAEQNVKQEKVMVWVDEYGQDVDPIYGHSVKVTE